MTNMSKNFQFKSYIFNTFLNGLAIALYESDDEYKIVVETECGAKPGYMTICQQKRFWGDDGVTQYLTDNYVSNDDDMHYNQARAVSNIIHGLALVDV